MIRGIGTDIIEIGSIQKAMEQSKRFAQRVFTENEISYCENKPNKYQHYAVRFAAKEALMKALKTGWNNGIQWKQIEVLNQAGGAPVLFVSGKTKERLDEAGITTIEVSLSHSEQYAIAMVCVQEADSNMK
jgi:holo-[acyl-carrier protein] synthase